MELEFAGVLHLILLIHIQGSSSQKTWSVTCDDENICTLETMHVFIKCSYTLTNVHTVIWFSPKLKDQWKNENDPEDLALDLDFAGRVSNTMTPDSSTLTITDVRRGDSGEYRFMLVTGSGEKYYSSRGVNVTVTDLQVRIHPGTTEQELHLTCSTHCRLATNWITWWKDGKRIKAHQHTEPLILSAGDGGSYTCSVKTKAKMIDSPAVCIRSKNCWNVTYAQRKVCALKGSSVNFPCTYSYPSGQKVNESYWAFNQNDVRFLEQFAGRVEFVGDKVSNCTLRLTDLKESDSGHYCFLFTTDTTWSAFRCLHGVELTVTDVRVRVSSSTESQRQMVTLTCITNCTLPYQMFSWYQNGQRIMNNLTKYNSLYLDVSSYQDKDEYTCDMTDIEVRSCTAASVYNWWWIQHALWAAGGFIAVLTLAIGIQLIRRSRRTKNNTDTQGISNPVEDTYTSLDPVSMSPVYDTLKVASLTDTYTPLSTANRSSDYSTLSPYSGMMRRTERDALSQVKKALPSSTVEKKASASAYENVHINKF